MKQIHGKLGKGFEGITDGPEQGQKWDENIKEISSVRDKIGMTGSG